MKDKVMALLKCGILILEDACPPNPDKYICKDSDFYDESACKRCWTEYLYAVANE